MLTVPAETAFQSGMGPVGPDLYNECNQITPASTSDVSTDVPVVEIDPDGEVITGYILADNYFELWVNDKRVAVDSIVKFKARRPITYAFKVVDWEDRVGLGMENLRGDLSHTGDGGLIARFSDGTVTDSSWEAQSFYIAPLTHPRDVVEHGNLHDTTALGRVLPLPSRPLCEDACYAVHYPIPDNWMSPLFDSSGWPRAYEYTAAEVGSPPQPAYARFPELFADAQWIWSLNLVFDNLVIARKTVP